MSEYSQEKRKHKRYQKDIPVDIHFAYDVDTRVDYQVVSSQDSASSKCPSHSKNISAEGIGIFASEPLHNGDQIKLDVYVPESAQPVHMSGKVMWSCETANQSNDKFEVGIQIVEVEGEPVQASLYYDEEYHVEWSNVLEYTLGKFRIIAQERTDK